MNQTSYQSPTGAIFDVFCPNSLNAGEAGVRSSDLYFTYASDFLVCLNGWAMWNTNKTLAQSGGVSFGSEFYEPDGAAGDSWCVYRWNVHGPFYAEGWDSAQLKSTYGKCSRNLADCSG
jgi:hypothetical protein